MASWPPKKNAAFTFYVGLIDQADTKLLKANPTLAAGDAKVATDDGAPVNLATLPVVDADFTKRVKVAMSAGEMNGDRITVIFSDAAGAEWADLIIDIPTSVRQTDDLAFPATSGRSIQVETDGMVHADAKEWLGVAPNALASGRVDSSVGAMAAAVLTAAAIAADAITAAKVAADVHAEAADAIWDEDIEAAHGTDATAGLLLRVLGAVISNRTNNATLDALLGVADSASNDVPNQILAGDTLAELTQAAPDAVPTLAKALMLMYMALRNKLDITTSTMEIHNDAGTVITKKALTDDATTYSEAEAIAGP